MRGIYWMMESGTILALWENGQFELIGDTTAKPDTFYSLVYAYVFRPTGTIKETRKFTLGMESPYGIEVLEARIVELFPN